MLLVLALAGVIWGLGRVFGVPCQARALLLALLYVVVLAILAILPEGHPLRQSLGGSMGNWLVVGALGVLVYGYAMILARLRRAVPPPPPPVPSPDRPRHRASAPSPETLERYSRHILLREIGGPGQRRLGRAHVLAVGAGGVGSPALLYLAAAGVGRITVVDDDRVSLSNLQRQILHATAEVGRAKVDSAARALRALNPEVVVEPVGARLDAALATRLFPGVDLILDGSDSYATRAMVNAAAVAARVPLLSAALTQWEGQITLFDPARGAPCMACLFPAPPAPGLAPDCAEAGVAGPLPGVLGTMMALEAVKEVTGAGTGLRGRLVVFDGLHGETRSIVVRRDPSCPVCARAGVEPRAHPA